MSVPSWVMESRLGLNGAEQNRTGVGRCNSQRPHGKLGWPDHLFLPVRLYPLLTNFIKEKGGPEAA
jgi:hypothetical protein